MFVQGRAKEEDSSRPEKLHNEDLRGQGRQVQEGEICGTYDMHGDNKNAHRVLVGQREGRKPFGRPREQIGLECIEQNLETGEGEGGNEIRIA